MRFSLTEKLLLRIGPLKSKMSEIPLHYNLQNGVCFVCANASLNGAYSVYLNKQMVPKKTSYILINHMQFTASQSEPNRLRQSTELGLLLFCCTKFGLQLSLSYFLMLLKLKFLSFFL